MADVQELNGSAFVSSTPVTVYENLNRAEHKGYLFFTAFGATDEFNFTVEVLDKTATAYAVVTSKNIDYAKLQSFTDKAIELSPRITNQIRIKMSKVNGTDRTVNYTMYAVMIT